MSQADDLAKMKEFLQNVEKITEKFINTPTDRILPPGYTKQDEAQLQTLKEARRQTIHHFRLMTTYVEEHPDEAIKQLARVGLTGASLDFKINMVEGAQKEVCSIIDKNNRIRRGNPRNCKPSDAVPWCDKILRDNPDDVDTLRVKGLALHCLNKHGESMECYDKILRLSPDDAGALFEKGTVLSSLEKYSDAISCYTKALLLRPDDLEIRRHMAFALYKLGSFEDAIKQCEKTFILKDDHRLTLLICGTSLQQLNRDQQAISCYDKILQKHPGDSSALEGKATSLKKLAE